MEINQETREKFQEMAKAIAKVFTKVREWFAKFFQKNWSWLKEAAIKWYQLEEEKEARPITRQFHKRDFSRQKISHQVIDRKPRQMVRKIIRG